MDNMYIYSVIISAATGGLIGIISVVVQIYFAAHVREKRLRKSIALSFCGEINAIIKLVRKRRYIEALESLVESPSDLLRGDQFYFHAKRDYFAVYNKNVDKIGILAPPLPELIIEFYTQANGILEDMGGLLQPEYQSHMGSDEKLETYRELLDLFKDTMDVGNRILIEADRKYRD